ncbi:hypothetical protein ADL05_06165 [Nocardiopsis sp. NRRL B-16309]|nr:hypothetical protein ADL05_06165 [Nocardiopsis sp. NRRL B-16309]
MTYLIGRPWRLKFLTSRIMRWNSGRLAVLVAERPGSTYSLITCTPRSPALVLVKRRWVGIELPSGS